MKNPARESEVGETRRGRGRGVGVGGRGTTRGRGGGRGGRRQSPSSPPQQQNTTPEINNTTNAKEGAERKECDKNQEVFFFSFADVFISVPLY